MTLAATTAQATFEKYIGYDRVTKDYMATLDGQLIGYFNSYREAEIELDRVAYDWLTHGHDRPASEMDAPIEECDDLPENIVAAQRAAAAQPPALRAERCACGEKAAWEVAFCTEPLYEYFCDAHLDPTYIADPIVWPTEMELVEA